MNAKRQNTINIAATGILATILLCIGLFWARWLCHVMRADLLPRSAREVTIYPASRVSTNDGADPNFLAPPRVTASMPSSGLLTGLGTLHYLLTRVPGLPAGPSERAYVYGWSMGPDNEQMYFDRSLGLIVRRGTQRIRRDDGTHIPRHFIYYAGPEGVSEIPDDKLGRFISPVVDTFQVEPQAVYDRALRRFFAIHWRENDQRVKKGPELADNRRYEPVQIGWLQKNLVSIEVLGPEPPFPFGRASSTSASWDMVHSGQLLILDASGRIDLLNIETLDIREAVAHLAMPITPFQAKGAIARPDDVAAYNVVSLQCRSSNAGGIAVATLSREGLALELQYFDTNGLEIAGSRTLVPRYYESPDRKNGAVSKVASEEEAYYNLPGAQVLTGAQFVLESLHPPVLVLASYFAGPHLEATAGYRSTFLLADSFVAKTARDSDDITLWERFLWAFGYMVPGLLLFGLLAVKVERDGIRVGTPPKVRRAWGIATIILGLPAYITYRVTRPKVALVTCRNCGLGRRTDLEKCHRCGSVWAVPELTPPAWRVVDEPEQTDEVSPSRTEETGSPSKEA